MKHDLLAVVRTTVDFPEFGICAGDVGTVVEVYEDGEYEVEFCDPDGETRAQFALDGSQIRPASLSIAA